MSRSMSWPLLLALLAACNNKGSGDDSGQRAHQGDDTGADGGTGTDGGGADGGGTDGGGADGGGTDGGGADGGGADGGGVDGGGTDGGGGGADGGGADGGGTDGGGSDGGSTDGGSTDGGSTDGGSPDGLDDAVAQVVGAGGGFGVRVAGGDVTGDGVDDLLVGSYFTGDGYEGEALLFAGPISGDLDTADAEAALVGTVAEGALGYSVAITQDADGDGIDDILLGAPGTGGSSSSIAGYAYLVAGPPTGALELPDDAFAVFVGAETGANAGSHAIDVGDVDADGAIDFLIGAQQAHDLGGSTGQCYLVFGPVSGTHRLDDVATTTFYGAEWAGGMGDWASSGDLTGDGISDLVLPANTSSPSGVVNGTVFVVSDPAAGLLAVDRDADAWITGETYTGFGLVSAVGDWTGDGQPDLVASDGTLPGTTYLFSGPLSGESDVTDALATYEGLGLTLMDRSGWALARVDLDHDGNDDLAIGSPHIDETMAGPGAVHVFYGLVASGSHRLDEADVALEGTAPDALGWALTGVGDTSGDGLEELAVTSLYNGGGMGAVWLFQ